MDWYVFVAEPSFRRTFSSALRTAGGETARSSAEIPPFSSLILPTTARAASRESDAILVDTVINLYREALSREITLYRGVKQVMNMNSFTGRAWFVASLAETLKHQHEIACWLSWQAIYCNNHK